MKESRFFIKLAVVAALASMTGSTLAQQCEQQCYPKRWVYWAGNLMDPNTFNNYKELLPQIKASGFNGIVVSSSGTSANIGLLDKRWSNTYRESLRNRLIDVTKAANNAGLELIPVGGNPEGPQYLQPSLTEAFPTTTIYKVVKGRAGPANGAVNLIGNPGFEASQLAPWGTDSWVAAMQGGGTLDETVAHTGKHSIRLESKLQGTVGFPATRLIQQVKVRPHTAYRLSFWLKSGAFANPAALRLLIMGSSKNGEAVYAHADHNLGWGVSNGAWNGRSNSEMFAANQPWTQYNVQFNSGEKDGIGLYLGTWTLASSRSVVWVDDVELREIGISRPIERKDGKDYIVQSKDGVATYTRGKDYEIDGDQLFILNRAIADGAELNVNWRQSAEHIFASAAPSIACENGEYFNWQKKIYDAIDPIYGRQPSSVVNGSKRKYFLYYDEIRIMNWETQVSGCSMPSAADYVRRMLTGVQRKLPADLEFIVWNDMFDPTMNGVAQYYQVRGSLAHRSSEFDADARTVIVNWTSGSETSAASNAKRQASLKYFRNQRQVIALYYDVVDSTDAWLTSLTAALRKDPALKIDGLMYTTWANRYGDLQEVARRIRASPHGKHWPAAR